MNIRSSARYERARWLTAVVANSRGEIFDLSGYAAVGCDGPRQVPLKVKGSRRLPHGGELMYLPDRRPVVYDIHQDRILTLAENPYAPGDPVFPVAAFNSPGYVSAYTAGYEEMPNAGFLPLFSYAAVGWSENRFYSPVIQVDREPRQDLRRMPRHKVVAGVNRLRRQMPENRLRMHLEKCALHYGCPAGKNFFLGRYEAPLPTSTKCNARCLGCISLQVEGHIHCSQERIKFTPTADEIAEVALGHILRVRKAVVSFGQGCEGDPLMVSDTIAASIRKIRSATDGGTINLNTNGSLPDKIQRLIDAGLDSMRVSMNSVRKACYLAYFRPQGYRFEDVLTTIDLALAHGVCVALNYLNCPGFTDTPEERDSLMAFLKAHPVQMIQWRNLNYDPQRYLKAMKQAADQSSPIGMRRLLQEVRQAFPDLRYGYYNPPKEMFRRIAD